jgi:hypothetical protein
MDLYPWSFDSIHSHCHDDVNSILNIFRIILKNFGLSQGIAHLRGVFKKCQFGRELAHNGFPPANDEQSVRSYYTTVKLRTKYYKNKKNIKLPMGSLAVV